VTLSTEKQAGKQLTFNNQQLTINGLSDPEYSLPKGKRSG
jgi:hypothetical protein